MITFRFGADDLLRTRFAISPLLEVVGAFYAMRWPDRYHVHRRWALEATDRCRGLDLALFDAAAPRGGDYWPVFLGQPPIAPHTTIEAELDRVARTDPRRVVLEITRTYPREVPASARRFLDDPASALASLVEQMRSVWQAALAPHWRSISTHLEAEIAGRARQLVAGGLAAAFGDLHPHVRWLDGVLTVDPSGKAAATVDLDGRGLLLVPAVFSWPEPWPRTDPPWEPALVYPPRGSGAVWTRATDGRDTVAALMGRGRSRVLRSLRTPASTTELAQRLGMSAGGVSEHLTVLTEAGLATRVREGARVVSSRTPLGDLVCADLGPEPAPDSRP